MNTTSGVRVIGVGDGVEAELDGYEFVSWSPDGSLVALIQGQELSIFDRSLSVPLVTRTVGRYESVYADYPSWSPDSKRIGYFIDPNFHVIELESGVESVIQVCPEQADPFRHPFECLGAEWSRSLDRIRVNYYDGILTRARLSSLEGADGVEFQFGSWSPDGRFLYAMDGDDYDWDFRIINAQTQEDVIRLAVPTPDASGIYIRRWEGICHFSELKGPHRAPGDVLRTTWNVCEGGAIEQLPSDMGIEQASWSADGRWVAFIEAGTRKRRRLVVYDTISGVSQVRCQADPSDFFFAVPQLAWSPDGSAFVATATGAESGTHLGLFLREDEAVRWLGTIEGEAHWSP